MRGLVAEPDEPHRIARLGITAIPRPTEFPVPRMSEAETLAALRDLTPETAALATHVLAKAMTQTTNSDALDALGKGLTAVAARQPTPPP